MKKRSRKTSHTVGFDRAKRDAFYRSFVTEIEASERAKKRRRELLMGEPLTRQEFRNLLDRDRLRTGPASAVYVASAGQRSRVVAGQKFPKRAAARKLPWIEVQAPLKEPYEDCRGKKVERKMILLTTGFGGKNGARDYSPRRSCK